MGIGGHMLGEKKLNKLRAIARIRFDRAYRRNSSGEAVVWGDGLECQHYRLSFGINNTVAVYKMKYAMHWSSCPIIAHQRIHGWKTVAEEDSRHGN